MGEAFLRHVRRFPWITNVSLYGCLFAGGDFVHQWFSRGQDVDWKQTRNVAVVAFTFHGNFNFFWMRFLERRFPGTSARMLLRKVLLDQTAAAPLATSVFYTGACARPSGQVEPAGPSHAPAAAVTESADCDWGGGGGDLELPFPGFIISYREPSWTQNLSAGPLYHSPAEASLPARWHICSC